MAGLSPLGDEPCAADVGARGRSGSVPSPERYAILFLDGFHLNGSVEFEGWVATQRNRLREQVVRSGKFLAEIQEQEGAHDAAVQTMRRLLEGAMTRIDERKAIPMFRSLTVNPSMGRVYQKLGLEPLETVFTRIP